jgi:lysozyme
VIKGIDISMYQPKVDWEKVKADGIAFAIVKATDGVGYVDPKLTTHLDGARAAGVPCGCYHFAQPASNSGTTVAAARSDAEAEADWFLTNAFPKDGDVLPTLDLEKAGIPPERLVAWTRAWVDRVADRIGAKPMIYFSPSFWSTSCGDSDALADCPLWIAHYDVDTPRIPAAWSSHTIWQYTSSGSVHGITGNVDLDRLADGVKLSEILYRPKKITPRPETAPAQNYPGPLPKPEWFWPWVRWQLGVGEFEGLAADEAFRPDEAPRKIPDWAWEGAKRLRDARTP